MKQESKNFFDELKSGLEPEEALRQQKDAEAKGQRLDYLIHATFEQHEPGRELLEIWKESLLMQPGATSGIDLVEIGIKEGLKRFIRGIILTIRRVERDD